MKEPVASTTKIIYPGRYSLFKKFSFVQNKYSKAIEKNIYFDSSLNPYEDLKITAAYAYLCKENLKGIKEPVSTVNCNLYLESAISKKFSINEILALLDIKTSAAVNVKLYFYKEKSTFRYRLIFYGIFTICRVLQKLLNENFMSREDHADFEHFFSVAVESIPSVRFDAKKNKNSEQYEMCGVLPIVANSTISRAHKIRKDGERIPQIVKLGMLDTDASLTVILSDLLFLQQWTPQSIVLHRMLIDEESASVLGVTSPYIRDIINFRDLFLGKGRQQIFPSLTGLLNAGLGSYLALARLFGDNDLHSRNLAVADAKNPHMIYYDLNNMILPFKSWLLGRVSVAGDGATPSAGAEEYGAALAQQFSSEDFINPIVIFSNKYYNPFNLVDVRKSADWFSHYCRPLCIDTDYINQQFYTAFKYLITQQSEVINEIVKFHISHLHFQEIFCTYLQEMTAYNQAELLKLPEFCAWLIQNGHDACKKSIAEIGVLLPKKRFTHCRSALSVTVLQAATKTLIEKAKTKVGPRLMDKDKFARLCKEFKESCKLLSECPTDKPQKNVQYLINTIQKLLRRKAQLFLLAEDSQAVNQLIAEGMHVLQNLLRSTSYRAWYLYARWVSEFAGEKLDEKFGLFIFNSISSAPIKVAAFKGMTVIFSNAELMSQLVQIKKFRVAVKSLEQAIKRGSYSQDSDFTARYLRSPFRNCFLACCKTMGDKTTVPPRSRSMSFP